MTQQPTFIDHAVKVAGLSLVAWLVWRLADATLDKIVRAPGRPR